MDYIQVTGKTVDEALTNALVQLETTSDNVEYEVIDKGSNGILGIGRKPAVIKARKKTQTESIDIMSAVQDVKLSSDNKESKNVEKKAEKKNDKKFDKKPEKKEFNKNNNAPKNVEKSVEKTVENAPKAQKSEGSSVVDKSEDKSEDKSSKYTTVMPNDEIERRVKTFLTDMFKAMDMEVEITLNFDDPECVGVNLSGDNMGSLIGKRGQTLDSIQYLTSLVVNKGKDKYVRIKLDTEDYRKRRKETLESLARNIAYKVKRSRRSVSLEPMNPYERRIIHSALQNDKFVSTRSEGEEPFRHVVVYLDRAKNSGER
ncbi:MAG: protein jag [Lachnospira sp.]|nr:protein jag [Lachnospira sp.]